MKSKKIIAIFIAVAFVLCAVICVFFLFNTGKVEVKFTASETADTKTIQTKLDKFNGKNLLFLNTNEVNDTLKDDYYYQVVSVSKNYPNVLRVEVKERKEVYYLKVDNFVYVLDETGFVLNKYSASTFDFDVRDKIGLSFEGRIQIDGEVKLGAVLNTTDNALFETVLGMTKAVSLYDCVKSITISNLSDEDRGAVFNTYAGGDINIFNIMDKGLLKIKTAITKFDLASDYVKSVCHIEVYTNEQGVIEIKGIEP